jgi:hypothetical protein
LDQHHLPAEKALLSKIKKVVSTIDDVVIQQGGFQNTSALESSLRSMLVSDRDKAFNAAYETMMLSFNAAQGRRIGEICIRTVYTDIMRSNHDN